MSHRNTVADCNRREYHRHAACLRHTKLHGIDNLIQIHMPRYDLIVRADNADHRLVHFLFRKS